MNNHFDSLLSRHFALFLLSLLLPHSINVTLQKMWTVSIIPSNNDNDKSGKKSGCIKWNSLYHHLTIICQRLLQHLKFLIKEDVALNITLECSEVMLSSFLSSISHIHLLILVKIVALDKRSQVLEIIQFS